MKQSIALVTAGTLLLVSPLAQAGHRWKSDPGYYDRAKVVKVEPIVRTVRVSTPQRECWDEEVRQPVYSRNHQRDGAALVGGIIGGVVGHKLGHGRGGATIAGTLIGASIADNVARQSHPDHYSERVGYETRCTVHTDYHTEERVEGYWVTYRYHGETFTTRTDYAPGKFIRVRVDITPYED